MLWIIFLRWSYYYQGKKNMKQYPLVISCNKRINTITMFTKRKMAGRIPITLTAIVLFTTAASAQKGISGLVNAERGFANFTASHSIKEGFLKYMDSAGIVFQRANPVNARQVYQQQKAGTAILNWRPEFAVISASGDMGITTGPYEFKPGVADSVSGRGSFSSVWQINKEGVWKNMVDLGTSYHVTPAPVNDVHQVVLAEEQPVGSTYEEVLAMEQKLNSLIQKKNIVALREYFPEDSRLNRDNYTPLTGTRAVVSGLEDFARTTVLVPITGNLAESKDLAWFYGTVISGTRKENYLRVWILRKGKWSVIVQTIKG